ncbi:zf-CCCH domain-containing protein [Rhizoctonia solani AG-1 IA]|uniref:Zf-CCCH domain-containing protein n=1 Tax=Thanatephorus cucumeris (strain AG1-IA) TaxID=983506 RepID=L8WVZ1_THACA|nr:zf-CCCH domain-containing protein [Rhizoctonia solani AG-1 IA]
MRVGGYKATRVDTACSSSDSAALLSLNPIYCPLYWAFGRKRAHTTRAGRRMGVGTGEAVCQTGAPPGPSNRASWMGGQTGPYARRRVWKGRNTGRKRRVEVLQTLRKHETNWVVLIAPPRSRNIHEAVRVALPIPPEQFFALMVPGKVVRLNACKVWEEDRAILPLATRSFLDYSINRGRASIEWLHLRPATQVVLILIHKYWRRMVSKPICRFFQFPGGCRQGINCRYAHNGTPDGSTDASSSGRHPPLDPNTPAGVCRYFWSRGVCNRGTSCTHMHQRPDSQGNNPIFPRGVCRTFWTSGLCGRGASCKFEHRTNPDAAPLEENAPNSLQSHFKAAGLGNFTILDTDKFCVGTGKGANPSETRSFLRRFLQDNFRFQTVTQIYSFLEIICNAKTQNAEWKLEDGQEHLHMLAKPDGNGVLRIGDVIRFPREENTLNGRTAWSFQRGYLSLLTYLSSEWVVRSTLHHDVKQVYWYH